MLFYFNMIVVGTLLMCTALGISPYDRGHREPSPYRFGLIVACSALATIVLLNTFVAILGAIR